MDAATNGARASVSHSPREANSRRAARSSRTFRPTKSDARREGLALAPSFLLAICSIPSFGIAETRGERLLPRYQQKYQQNGRLGSLQPRTFTCVFNAPRKFSQRDQESKDRKSVV